MAGQAQQVCTPLPQAIPHRIPFQAAPLVLQSQGSSQELHYPLPWVGTGAVCALETPNIQDPQHCRSLSHTWAAPCGDRVPQAGTQQTPLLQGTQHPSLPPELQHREGHGWLMQQPEPSTVPWALARAGEQETPARLSPQLGARDQDLTPHWGPRSMSPTNTQNPPLHPLQKGHRGAGEPTRAGFSHPMPGPGCSPGAAPTDRGPSSQFPRAAGGVVSCQARAPRAETAAGVHLRIWPG